MARRPTFVCTVDISSFHRKTTQMQFAAHIWRSDGAGASTWRRRLELLPLLRGEREGGTEGETERRMEEGGTEGRIQEESRTWRKAALL